jgi:hypothetical protein
VEEKLEKNYITFFALFSDGESYALLYGLSEKLDVRLEALVSKGLIGHSETWQSAVVLGPLSPEQHRLIFSEEGLFRWMPPSFVLIRLPDKLDLCKTPVQAK